MRCYQAFNTNFGRYRARVECGPQSDVLTVSNHIVGSDFGPLDFYCVVTAARGGIRVGLLPEDERLRERIYLEDERREELIQEAHRLTQVDASGAAPSGIRTVRPSTSQRLPVADVPFETHHERPDPGRQIIRIQAGARTVPDYTLRMGVRMPPGTLKSVRGNGEPVPPEQWQFRACCGKMANEVWIEVPFQEQVVVEFQCTLDADH